MERSRQAITSADLVLAVVDGTEKPTGVGEIFRLAAECPHWIAVYTKRDLAPPYMVLASSPAPAAPPAASVSLSSVTGEGLDKLEKAVSSLFPAGDPKEAGSLLTDQRQEEAVRRARDAVRRAKDALDSGLTPDAVLTDAEEALDALGELTGRTAREEIVSRIFSRFCVGK